tara:strand:- start:506 stop:739 length:234 start_codon:yes stop_codon:yes gene_type:complete
MPTYTLKNKETEEYFEVFCTYNDLQNMLGEDTSLSHVIKAPDMVTMVGSTLGKTSNGWKDLLKSVKKGSGRNNTIKV